MILLPPSNLSKVPEGNLKIFLAGSIEMGKAEDWQSLLSATLDGLGYTVFNPRRKSWDSTFGQSFEDAQFAQQVNWELDALEQSDFILFYFAPNTNSIVSMLELGLMIGKNRTKVAVICSEDYCRKGNIDIVCYRDNILQFENFEEAIVMLTDIQIRKHIKVK